MEQSPMSVKVSASCPTGSFSSSFSLEVSFAAFSLQLAIACHYVDHILYGSHPSCLIGSD